MNVARFYCFSIRKEGNLPEITALGMIFILDRYARNWIQIIPKYYSFGSEVDFQICIPDNCTHSNKTSNCNKE